MQKEMKSIQMVDLSTQYERIREEMDNAIGDVIRSGKYINSEVVREFAGELSGYIGSRRVIPCANGTDALQIALMSLHLQAGDEVIVPAFTYAATAEAIALLKLRPVLVDVNPRTFNIDVDKIEDAISSATKAIVPVHLFGQCCDMEPLMLIARKYGLSVIEDNAQSIGSVYTFRDGTRKQAGTIGDIGTLSFFPSKNLGAYGDGGALLTDDEGRAEKLRMIASHGQSRKYTHDVIGCNSRLDAVQAAVLRVKLPYLDAYIRARAKAALEYDTQLKPLTDLLETPSCISSSTHVYHQYTVKVKRNRDDFQSYLKENGIPSMIYYPLPLHHQQAFKDIVKMGGDLSETERLCRSVLSIPMHTELGEEQIRYIISRIKSYEFD
ncbi:MAG: DegT/DnrJ/EryC1/StrS family aminotransferase [Candidatus Symbiothrix sp.]|jgi:dTDP-4-amino-4,6-dideoxygalactose transaminase|nr:DegT/DnrJ/EryC1/StrS family aminotransferase [Candidatus Symbiothrix sp.]